MRCILFRRGMPVKLTEGSTTKDACKDADILIDNIQFIYGTNTNDINNPTIESVTETTTNTVLYDGQEPEVTGSSLNFTVNYSDSEATDKYASGIDAASTRVYIDGVNQTANAEINTGSLYLRNLNLRNGEHSLDGLSQRICTATRRTRHITSAWPTRRVRRLALPLCRSRQRQRSAKNLRSMWST